MAKKGTHVKKNKVAPKKSPKKKLYSKNNSNDITIDADIQINAETPSKIESQMLNGIKLWGWKIVWEKTFVLQVISYVYISYICISTFNEVIV